MSHAPSHRRPRVAGGPTPPPTTRSAAAASRPVARHRRPAVVATRRIGTGALALGAVVATIAVGSGAHAPAAHAATSVVAMTVSTAPYTDTTGKTWSAASGFNGVRLSTPAPTGAVHGPNDPGLYKVGNWQMSSWQTSLPNGFYGVTLKMSDTWFSHAGMRLFNVTAEGSTVLSNVDIAGHVGQYGEYDRSFNTTVKDGVLTLGWQAIASYPTVSAIMVTPLGSATPPTTAPPTTTPPTTTPPATPPSTTVPGASNTGVPAGTVLSRRDGWVFLTTPGGVYSNLDIHGRVRVMAPNVTLKNSIVRGDNSATFGSLIDVNYPYADHTNFTLTDSELVPEYPSYYQDGILGHDYTVTRSNIHGTVDAAKVTGDNVTIQNSWLHDTTYMNTPVGPTHNDGIQATKGNHVRVLNNTITGNSNSAVMLGQDQGPITDWIFTGNHMDNGGCSVNTASKGYSSIGPLTFTNNVFGTHQVNPGCAIVLNAAKTRFTASGNVWVNGSPVAISRGL